MFGADFQPRQLFVEVQRAQLIFEIGHVLAEPAERAGVDDADPRQLVEETFQVDEDVFRFVDARIGGGSRRLRDPLRLFRPANVVVRLVFQLCVRVCVRACVSVCVRSRGGGVEREKRERD